LNAALPPPPAAASTPAVRVVAFDCDGVLFDTEASNQAFYNRVLAHIGRPPMTPGQCRFAMMHTVDQTLAHLIQDRNQRVRADRFRRSLDYRSFVKHMRMAPHLIETLQALKPRCNTAVVTNRIDTLDGILDAFHIRHWFDLCVTAADVARPKPHPAPLLRVLRHFGVQPPQMLYVGDSVVDESAAAAAGVPFVAYRNPSLTADRHIEDLAALTAFLI